MNISGSDVSKEAANMILLGEYETAYIHSRPDIFYPDDNFASTVSKYTSRSENHVTDRLAEGVAEGRQIFVNLKRSIQFVIFEAHRLLAYSPARYTITHSTPEVIPQLLCEYIPRI
jgi:sodium/potassium-transporting ATPase subunit alpha